MSLKDCKTCGHPRLWHVNSRKCSGSPKRGYCAERCQKFKPYPLDNKPVDQYDGGQFFDNFIDGKRR